MFPVGTGLLMLLLGIWGLPLWGPLMVQPGRVVSKSKVLGIALEAIRASYVSFQTMTGAFRGIGSMIDRRVGPKLEKHAPPSEDISVSNPLFFQILPLLLGPTFL